MRKLATLPDGLMVMANLYKDHLLFAGTIAFALFVGSYFLAH